MNLRPLGDRVLIKPELPPETTESGLILAEQRKPEQTGTVVAVGPCDHPLKAQAFDLASQVEVWAIGARIGDDAQNLLIASCQTMREATQREPSVKVGDYVVFSWMAGQELWVEHGEDRYLLMRESDILAVVEGLSV